MEENGICGRSEDLDRIIVAALDAQGRRVASKHLTIGRIRAIWIELTSIHGSRLQNITPKARERWLLFRISRSRFEPCRSVGTNNERLSAVRTEWHSLASKGFFKELVVYETHLQAFNNAYLQHVEEILATLRMVQDNGGIIPLESLLYVWRNHLEARISVFELPDPQLYRFIEDTLSAKQTGPSGSFDAGLRESLGQGIAEVTGNIPVSMLSLYLPTEKTTDSNLNQISSSDLQRALSLTRRRLKHIPTQPTESQTSSVVSTLGFAALLVEEAVAKKTTISDSFVLAICRGFKYLPTRIRTDDRHSPRLHSALLLVLRSLRRQNNSLKRWITIWPNMLETMSSYAADAIKRDLLSQTIFIYRQLQSRNDPEYLEFLSAFRRDFARTILNAPWISLELYADALISGCDEDLNIRDSIVFRISTMNNPGYLRRLRDSIGRNKSERRDPIIISVIEDAVAACDSSEHALKLYDVLDETQREPEKSVKALELLLEKIVKLGDHEQRQRAVSKVEEAYNRGARLPRGLLERLAELVEGGRREAEMDHRLEMIEADLRGGKRLHVIQGSEKLHPLL